MTVLSPIADTNDVTLLKTIQIEELIHNWDKIHQIDITSELHGYSEIKLYQCNQTKLKFFVPFEVAGSGKLYEKLQNFDWYYVPDKWEHQVALQNLSDCQQILEVGCGFGAFIKMALDFGLNIKGIELNQSAVEIARQQNLPVESIDLHDFTNLYPKSMDAICSFQVLEHIADPKSFLTLLIDLLKPNGKLILCVPNADSFLKYYDNLLDMPPHHMTQWSEFSFKALEKIFPIEIEKVIREPLASEHVSWCVGSYRSHLCSISPLAKLLFNRYTCPVYEKILQAGMKNFVTGQSLYVQFRKV
jgi:2-polyprenyl-3-methyl-5-hydroxy-6-metoxy-1,4-benzoquinol methylase